MRKLMKTKVTDLTVGGALEAATVCTIAVTAIMALPFVGLIGVGCAKEKIESHKKAKAKTMEEETED